jgi:hypothetical protein
VPVSRFGADAARQWIETELDWPRMAAFAISHVEVGGAVFGAEAVLAQALGTGPHQQSGTARAWTPQGQVPDAFVTDFIRLAITEEASHDIAMPVRALVAPLLRAALDLDCVGLHPDVRIEQFTGDAKRDLWTSHGWGSLAMTPLSFHEIVNTTHAIVIEVEGERLGGWDWSKAQERVPRALLALRLVSAGPVAAPWALLRPQAVKAASRRQVQPRRAVQHPPVREHPGLDTSR